MCWLDLLILIGVLLLTGWVATALAEEPEEGLFLKGVGYALLGNFLINLGSVPIPLTQIIGAFMAARSPVNRRSRWWAWGIGLALRILPPLVM